MKAFQASALAVILIAASCVPSGREATLASAQKFAEQFVAELRTAGSVVEEARSPGQAGNVCTEEISCSVPIADFPVGTLATTANAALSKWGEYESYGTRGKGESGGRFELQFGNHRSHAFVDVLAFPEADRMRVLILIRVLQ